MRKKVVVILILLLLLIGIKKPINAETTENNEIKENQQQIGVEYRGHVQNVGWQDWKKDGELIGTEGRTLRLEAVNIKLKNMPEGIKIKYQAHVQNIGWQNWKFDGELAGTEGQELRLEAIKIELEGTEEYTVRYRVHVQSIGWQDWKSDGELAGTIGEKLRVEAIEIKIEKKEPKGIIHLDTATNGTVYYSNDRLIVKGWKMADVSNTTIDGYIDGKIIEKDKIKYQEREDVLKEIKEYGTEKQNTQPGFEFEIDTKDLKTGNHTIVIILNTEKGEKIAGYQTIIKIDKDIHIKYKSHVQGIGWQEEVQDGELSGTEGQELRLEAIKIQLINAPENTTIKYQVHIQNIGWQNWKQNEELAGTIGETKRIEAIRIKLEGNTEYSIMYRVHVQSIGWQPWSYDGEMAGTEGISKRIEAIEIKIVPKIQEVKAQLYIDNPTNQIANQKQNVKGWVMTTVEDTKLKVYIDDKEIELSGLEGTPRQDVLNEIKGFGNYNETPGFEIELDFSKYELGKHNILIQVIYKNSIITQAGKEFTIRKKIEYSEGSYGISGLKVAGDSRGTDLPYYKYGSGPNVFYATFAIHGFEDLWYRDGQELVTIANNFYQKLIDSNDFDLAEKWTIYIFPGVNQDGLNYGNTKDGPGRTSLYSEAPSHKGIDMNRCWQVGSDYKIYTSDRNYNGTTGFQAYETQYLRNFLINNKSQNGETILVDLHGWTQQLIGDNQICSYYGKQFPENDTSAVGRYGTGYLIDWARSSLGAKSALIELPNQGIKDSQSVKDRNYSNRYIEATLNMLKNM